MYSHLPSELRDAYRDGRYEVPMEGLDGSPTPAGDDMRRLLENLEGEEA